MQNLSSFTPAQRDACLPIVSLMVECANVARTEGVLALEEWQAKQESKFLRFLVMLMVDGTDPELVKGMGKTLLESGGHEGEALLSRMMLLEGVLSVQWGEHPRYLEDKLLCMLGESYLIKRSVIQSLDANDKFEQQLSTLEAQLALPNSEAFHDLFAKLSNRDIQQVLREIDQFDFTIALKGCAGTLAKKFVDNISKRLGAVIMENMAILGPLRDEDILNAQNKMLDIVKKMQETGAIVCLN